METKLILQYDDQGNLIAIGGKCKAKHFRDGTITKLFLKAHEEVKP